MAQNIIAAPEIEVTPALQSAWSAAFPSYQGSIFQFLTTPSPERDRWLRSLSRSISFEGPICIQKYS